MTNSYKKLESGEWGVQAALDLVTGTRVTVTKKDGSRKIEVLGKCVRAFQECAVYTIKRTYRVGQDCPRCGSEPLDQNLSCWECGFSAEE